MELPIDIDDNAEIPFYRRLCDAIRKAIVAGKLKPGDFLPSSRQLADSLSISRVTVVRSYEELLSQGYLEAAVGMGTLVSRSLGERLNDGKGGVGGRHVEPAVELPLRLSNYGKRLLQTDAVEYTSTYFPELNYGAPPLDCLPIKQWKQILMKRASQIDENSFASQNDPFGQEPLRAAIAAYLRRRRGVQCEMEQVALFGGVQHVLNLIARVLVDPDSNVAIESSGYCDARQAFLAQKARLHPISIDGDGFCVDELSKIAEDLRLVFLSPSHHNPSGVATSKERREALLQWATQTNTIIVEDDYDHEFRYTGAPTQSLQSMDTNEVVIYFGSFWKLLFPLSTMHYVVFPKRLVSVFSQAKLLSQRTFALLEQEALADLLNDGLLERHIRSTRPVYAKRRQALVYALTRHLSKAVTIGKESSGMHFMIHLNTDHSDEFILECASKANLSLVSTRPFYIDQETRGEFLADFAHHSEEQLQEAVSVFASLVAPQ